MLMVLVKANDDGSSSSSSGKKQYEVGKTKVYFRSGVLEELEERRVKVLGQRVMVIQRYCRGYLTYQRYHHLRNATIVFQSLMRAYRQSKR